MDLLVGNEEMPMSWVPLGEPPGVGPTSRLWAAVGWAPSAGGPEDSHKIYL